jgi:hemolysin D
MSANSQLTLPAVRTLPSLPVSDPLDFAPALLRVQRRPPSPIPRRVLRVLVALFVVALLWLFFGRLDIVAVAPGKLVPETYLQVVQPSEPGIVAEILVKEGDLVDANQVLIRLDPQLSGSDLRALESEYRLKELQLRRIDAELTDAPLSRGVNDPIDLFSQVESQFRARRQALEDALASERAALSRAQQELQSAVEVESKLRQITPFVTEQEKVWAALGKEGFAATLVVNEKVRARMENDQALKAQSALAESLRASVEQSQRRLTQITSNWRQSLLDERMVAKSEYLKTKGTLEQRRTRHGLLELRAPRAGRVQELATHTVGSVVGPGSVVVTLVPRDQPLRAEVWVSNRDIGFVREGQRARLKLTAFQFQKYGLVDGVVRKVSPDASDRDRTGRPQMPDQADAPAAGLAPLRFRALIEPATQVLEAEGIRYALSTGMEVTAEIHLGERTLWEYLTSPVRGAFHDAGRER